jgi:hypothetical protein
MKVALIRAAEVFARLPKEAGKQGKLGLIWAEITSINNGEQIT